MSRSITKNIKSRKGREQRFLLHSEMNNLEKDNDRHTHRSDYHFPSFKI